MIALPRSRLRLAALVGTALLLWWLREFVPAADPVAQPVRRADGTVPARPRVAVPAPSAEDLCLTPAALPQRSSFAAASPANPFSEPPPPAPRRIARAEPPAAAASAIEPPPPPPPKLPYRFFGVFNEPGKAPTVFLGLGNALIHARAGDTLEGGFRLEAIGRRELSFVHLQQNLTLRLPIDGDPS